MKVLHYLLTGFICGGLTLMSQESVPSQAEGFLFDAHVPLDQEAVQAIERAQKWIASQQQPDGGFPTKHGRNNTGEISFALLALMVDGDVPGEGEYAEEIGKGLQFLLNIQQPSGLICATDNSKAPMYQHALAVVLLSEIYGMTANPRIRTALIQGVNLIVRTQHSQGGWRYRPMVESGDVSATVMQVMALRGAAEAGIYVPKETIDNATRFIENCFNQDDGGFSYTPRGGKSAFPRTAAGVVSMQTLGHTQHATVHKGVSYIMEATEGNLGGKHFWYGHYYASVALYHYGGEDWKTYYPRIRGKIIRDWEQRGHYNGVLDTAWATLVLGVPYRYLPIYQR
jgi:prenyltransferase beta subunit